MFIVLNKEKIYSYLVSLTTVIILFVIAFYIVSNREIIETAASPKQLPIYHVDTKEKMVALTMNCAWRSR